MTLSHNATSTFTFDEIITDNQEAGRLEGQLLVQSQQNCVDTIPPESLKAHMMQCFQLRSKTTNYLHKYNQDFFWGKKQILKKGCP